MYDAIIVGGGPAGLNAALVLGRCRRRVLLIDEGKPRNRVSRGVNGFITRENILPHDLRAIAHAELADYPTIEIREGITRTAASRPYSMTGGANSRGKCCSRPVSRTICRTFLVSPNCMAMAFSTARIATAGKSATVRSPSTAGRTTAGSSHCR
jgi:choline dehydrogenase-like flavoprotein